MMMRSRSPITRVRRLARRDDGMTLVEVIIATSLPLGRYVWKVFTDQRTWLDPLLGPIERAVLSGSLCA